MKLILKTYINDEEKSEFRRLVLFNLYSILTEKV